MKNQNASMSSPIRVLVRIRPATRQEYTDGENTRPAVVALPGNSDNSFSDAFGLTSDMSKHGGGIVRVFSPAPTVSGSLSSSSSSSSSGFLSATNHSSLQVLGIAGKSTETPNFALSSSSLSSISEQSPTVIHDQAFDRVFPPTSTQQDVFDELVELVTGVAAGINATVFAYGQTGTGKTHTMMGGSANSSSPNSSIIGADTNSWGVIPRATELLFKKLEEITIDGSKSSISNAVEEGKRPPLAGEGSPSPVRIVVTLSYMQIYNDKVYDLLSSSPTVRGGGGGRGGGSIALFEKPLAIREGKQDEDLHIDPSYTIRAASGPPTGVSSSHTLYAAQKDGDDERNDADKSSHSITSRRSLSARRGDQHGDASANSNSSMRILRKGGRSTSSININKAPSHSSGSSGTNVHVVGLSQHSVTSFADVAVLLHRGSAMRAVRSTEFNEASSRSHAVLQFSVEIQREVPVLTTKVPGLSDGDSSISAAGGNNRNGRVIAIRRAKLNLVDLAGSEKWFSGISSSSLDATLNISGSAEDISTSSTRPYSSSSSSSSVAPNRAKRETRDRARELVSINKSLSALGNCIAALAEISEPSGGSGGGVGGGGMRLPRTHIPYRDSALTRLLRDSLGGNTRTAIIATISPSAMCLEETFSTLNFAGRARRVFCRVRVNEHATEALQLDRARREILRLRKELDAYKRLDALVVKASETVGGTDASSSIIDADVDNTISSTLESTPSDFAVEVTKRVAAVLSLSPNNDKRRIAREIDAAAVHATISSPQGIQSFTHSSSISTDGASISRNPLQVSATIDSDILDLIYSLALSSPLVAQQRDPNRYQPNNRREEEAKVNSPLIATTQSKSRLSGLSPIRLDSSNKSTGSITSSSNISNLNSKSPEAQLPLQHQLRTRRPSMAALQLAQTLGVSPSVLLSTGLMKSPYAQPVLNSPGTRHSSFMSRHALKLALEDSASATTGASEQTSSFATSPRLIPSSRLSRSYQNNLGENTNHGLSRGMAISVGENDSNSDDEGESQSPFSAGSRRRSPVSHRITVSPPTSITSTKFSNNRANSSRNPASPIIIELDTTVRGQTKNAADRAQDRDRGRSGMTSATAKRRAFIDKTFNHTVGDASFKESSDLDDPRALRRSFDRTQVVGYTAEYPNFTSDGSGVIVQSSHPIIFFSPQKSRTSLEGASFDINSDHKRGDSEAKNVLRQGQMDERGFYSPSIYPSHVDKQRLGNYSFSDYNNKPPTRLESQVRSIQEVCAESIMFSATKGQIQMASDGVASAPLQLSPSPRSRSNHVLSIHNDSVDESTTLTPPLLSVFFSPQPDNPAVLSAQESVSTTALGNAFSSPPPRSRSNLNSGITAPSPFDMSIAAGRKLDVVRHNSGPTTPISSQSSSSAESGFGSTNNFNSSGFSSSGFFYHSNAASAPYASPKAALPSRKGSAASVTAGFAAGLASPPSRRASTETTVQLKNVKSLNAGVVLFSPTSHENTIQPQVTYSVNENKQKVVRTAEDFVQEAMDEEISRAEAERMANLKPPGPPKTPRPTPRLALPRVSRIEERSLENTQPTVETTRSFDQRIDIEELHISSRATVSSDSSSAVSGGLSFLGLNNFADSKNDLKSLTRYPAVETSADLPPLYSKDDAQNALALLQMSPLSSTLVPLDAQSQMFVVGSLTSTSSAPKELNSINEMTSFTSNDVNIGHSGSDSQPVSPQRPSPLPSSLSTKKSELSLVNSKAEIEKRKVDVMARKIESDDLASSIEAIRERALAHLSQADVLFASFRNESTVPISSSAFINNNVHTDETVHQVTARHVQNETDRISAFLSRRKLQPLPAVNTSRPRDPSLPNISRQEVFPVAPLTKLDFTDPLVSSVYLL